MVGKRLGYGRVSTVDQNAQLQLDALTQAGCEQIFTDHGVSGTRASRPELDRMFDHLRPGQDEVVVWKLDKLGRNTPATSWRSLTASNSAASISGR